MADTIKLSGTYDSIEAYNILTDIEALEVTINGYKTDAETAATNAGTSETNAGTSATNAGTSESNASTYAGNALASANAAAGSANDALGSANSASGSATLASQWATKTGGTVADGEYSAKHYAQAAASSETNAAASAAAAALAITPTGSVLAFAGSTSPDGWLLCDGSAVSRTDYADLYAVIGTTYGSGNGTTTFNLPNLTDKFIQGNSTSGTVKNAGLPNITGSMMLRNYVSADAAININSSGAFSDAYQTVSASAVAGGTNPNKVQVVSFSASGSNSIYGNSTTVQPPAVTMRYIIKY